MPFRTHHWSPSCGNPYQKYREMVPLKQVSLHKGCALKNALIVFFNKYITNDSDI